jgi:hypothetical protein
VVRVALVLSLFLLVFELAEVHDAADRGLLQRRDLDQIESRGAGLLKRFVRGDDPELGPVVGNHADGRNADLLIDPLLFAFDRLVSYWG